MTLVQLFLIAWHQLSLLQCTALTSGAMDHPSVPFFHGACTDAISYANQVGGWWQYIVPPVVTG